MPKSKDVRPVITLACSECKHRNYTTQKNRRNDPNRMELDWFGPGQPSAKVFLSVLPVSKP